jgi:hypothetical protein
LLRQINAAGVGLGRRTYKNIPDEGGVKAGSPLHPTPTPPAPLTLTMISALFLASALAAPALAAPSVPKTPNVSLLTDLPLFPKTGPLAIKALLPIVSIRKNSTFHFGSTYDIYDWQNHVSSVPRFQIPRRC